MVERPAFVTSGLLTRASLSHLFTTREFPGLLPPASAEGPLGPEARVAIRALGLDANRIAFARQVHGADVMVASRGGRLGSGDALVTDCPGISLAVFTADCLPILIYDPGGNGSRPRLAAVHAGWRGTVAGVARAAVEAMAEAGGDPRQFAAAIGPSIGPCCYQVDRPVIDRLEMAFPHDWRAWITPQGRDADGQERWMLDLWRANEDQLTAAGVAAARIDNLRMCTSCRLDLFYSYRRGARGRMMSLAALPGSRGTC